MTNELKKTILKFGVLLFLPGTIATYILGITGWYRNENTSWIVYIVLPLQIAILIWGLNETKKQGNNYMKQLWIGTAMSLVAGLLTAAANFLYSQVFFPNYIPELRATVENSLKQAGRTAEELKKGLELFDSFYNPASIAMQSVVSTVLSGLVMSAITAIFIRAKNKPAPVPAKTKKQK